MHVDVHGTDVGLCGTVCICVSDHMSGSWEHAKVLKGTDSELDLSGFWIPGPTVYQITSLSRFPHL